MHFVRRHSTVNRRPRVQKVGACANHLVRTVYDCAIYIHWSYNETLRRNLVRDINATDSRGYF
jgi:hypothetical protein